jgi:hypothetical protein
MSRSIEDCLSELGFAIRRHLLKSRPPHSGVEAGYAVIGGDVIYPIDRAVEPIMIDAFGGWPDHLLPVLVIAEGLGPTGRRLFGPASRPPRWHLLIDPIDGSRGLMFDKRSAWFLACAAQTTNDTATLSEATVSVAIELPTSKQAFADHFIAPASGGVIARRVALATGQSIPIPARPSAADGLDHGFAHVASFFPGCHRLAADLMEHIASVARHAALGVPTIFNDQYLSTGGQLIELATGRDRFCCDLRPLFYKISAMAGVGTAVSKLECHPYDMAGLLVAQRCGVIVTDGFGSDISAPFGVDDGVHWCGYANSAIRALVEPVIRRWLSANGLVS